MGTYSYPVFGALLMVIEWLFMGVLYSGHGYPLLACRARELALFLGNPTCLNWPDCPNMYLVEEGVVFYGKRSGIEKYLSKLGLKVSLLEENV